LYPSGTTGNCTHLTCDDDDEDNEDNVDDIYEKYVLNSFLHYIYITINISLILKRKIKDYE